MTQITTKERTAVGPETMSAKCLACGYGNNPGEVSCAACGSSLDLKLCSACEAINASRAARCHACGVEFAAPEETRTLPAIWRMPRPPLRKSKQLAALIVLPLGATLALAYYVYGSVLTGSTGPVAAPVLAQKHESPAPAQKPASSATPAIAPAPVPAPAAKVAQPKEVREAPAKPKEIHQPSPVPVQAKSAPALAPPVRPVSEFPPSADKAAHPRVTHTRGPVKPVTAPLAATAGSINAAVRPVSGADTRNDGCSEAVTALGFCNRQGER